MQNGPFKMVLQTIETSIVYTEAILFVVEDEGIRKASRTHLEVLRTLHKFIKRNADKEKEEQLALIQKLEKEMKVLWDPRK